MFYQLPPAGHSISLDTRAHGGLSPGEIFHPWQAVYCHSGTAALAAAVMAAIRLKDVHAPEVILPAYGCPDLVSAVLHAGARPVLVDLEPQRPWMDLEQLASRLGTQTVAIIAVSLCGIPERVRELRAIAERSSVIVIEDSAQAFPKNDMESFWSGDLVVVSFGRGKPVSLLGGGAVLYQDDQYRQLLPECPTDAAAPVLERLGFYLQATIYNLMSSAFVYWMPARLPFLHLGETRFHPLGTVRCMDSARLGLLAANTDAYQHRSLRVQSALAGRFGELAARVEGLVDLPAVCNMPSAQVLLRYPVLLAPDLRDTIYKQLNKKGLGASRLYPAVLPGIAGLRQRLGAVEAFPAAQDFAARLLTLPTHERVRDADIRAMADCLGSIADE